MPMMRLVEVLGVRLMLSECIYLPREATKHQQGESRTATGDHYEMEMVRETSLN